MKHRLTNVFALIIAATATLDAATYTWNGSSTGGATGTSNNWDTTSANWTGTATIWPASGSDNDAVFAGTAGTVTISSGVTANDIAFNTNSYTVSGGTLTLNGTTPTITTPTGIGATISSVLAGSAGLTKTGVDSTGILTLSGNNTLSGTVNINSGALRLTNSNSLGTSSKTVNLNGGGGIATSLELRLDPGANGSIILPSAISFSTASNSANGIRNKSGNNEIKGNVNVRTGLASTSIGSDAGTLTLSGTISAGNSGRTLHLNGNSTNLNTVKGSINNGSGLAFNKGGNGVWLLSGSNTFANGATVSSGKLIVTSGSGLGTGNVAVSSNATLHYVPATDTPLSIGGTLAITGGTSTTIGCAIGSGTTSASINVTGAASITNAAHTVDLFGIPNVSTVTGNYTLISGGAGSALNPATTPTLGKVYNNSDFTVGGLTSSTNAIEASITAVSPLATAYWVGGLSTGANVWSLSDGSAASNWSADLAGTSQPLVPGALTDVIISATSPAVAPTATVLGADMTVNSLTISDTTNGLGISGDGYQLTTLSGGITMDAGVPASTIGARLMPDGTQTWTVDSENPLTISGVIGGFSSITKDGTGTLALAAANTHAGTFKVEDGTLSLTSINGLAGSILLRDATDTGVLSYDSTEGNTYNIGGLSGDGSLSAGGKTLSIGGTNLSSSFSGSISSGALTKTGTGTLTLSGASTFGGGVTINAGRLTIGHSDALGTGPKNVNMQGVSRSLYLTGGITLPSSITLVLSTNSADGTGLNNESGNNTIQGNIDYSFGNPGMNISSAADALTISGNVTLITTSRTFYLGGASTADNTISGNISENSTAVMPIIKQGAGKWIFSGTNTYKGDTDVRTGDLVLASGGSQKFLPKADGTCNKFYDSNDALAEPSPTAGNLTLDGAFDIDLTNATTASSWLLVDVASLSETYGSNFSVTGFTETPAASGIWKKTVGVNEYTFTEADGLLTRAAASNTFATWLAANPPATGFTTDSDNDGVPNGVENVLGTNPNAYSAGLTEVSATAGSATFKHTLNPTVASDVSYTYEWSTDLTEWKTSGQSNTGGVTATIAPSAPAAGVVTVVTTVTSGTPARLFARIKASQ
jgi:autotransporter-associated beta strand protein